MIGGRYTTAYSMSPSAMLLIQPFGGIPIGAASSCSVRSEGDGQRHSHGSPEAEYEPQASGNGVFHP